MRIFTFDIETSPHVSFHFGRWQQNIPAQNTINESHMTCFAAKELGKKKVTFRSDWTHGQEVMLDTLWDIMDEADVIVGFNSNKFDIKRVNGEFLTAGYSPPSPFKKIDLMLQAKKHFAFSSNRLKDILKRLGLSPKLEDNANMALWMDVHFGDKGAQKRMKEYNIQDVRSTEELYEYMLGWIQPHPNWGLFVNDLDGRPVCPNCGSRHVHKRGFETTKVRKYQRYQCQDCGSFHRGRASLGDTGPKTGVLG